MIPSTIFAGQTVALFGLGGSGLATALSLQAGGARVIACDDNPERMEAAGRRGVGTGDLRQADWTEFAALILAPGVPLTHPAPHWTVNLARGAGVPVIGDIELFCRERAAKCPEAPFVAITGTNGKSTTTALIAHVLAQAGRDVQMGGNIGTAILSLAPPSAHRVHVIELSSFQIDLTPSLAPTIGVLLNLTPDHLDRHGDMTHYAAIKERLVTGAAHAIVGVDDEFCRAIAGRRTGPLTRVHVGEAGEGPGILARNGIVIDGRREPAEPVADLSGIGSLRGAHNWQNAAIAYAVASELGVPPDAFAAALATFPGLPHRMEEVGRRGPVLFINDSKATNADSTEKALSAFQRVHWILGGKPKEGGIASLAPYFPRVVHAYLIGAATEDFAATLDGQVPFSRCGTLSQAVAAAAAATEQEDKAEPVVLLSPACASYDQFRSFEDRGDQFRDLVKALPGLRPPGA
ncbi:UDP-N-acetylmuramoyl-L-alanine--D-glutamate ligase [Methylobacterium frigidaeris]|uniref:UDP-N-acetylmuramoylalanine--D-glutamate ligase n=1 Tax=Methylobacterium frigidaeris TaxID=2038277 RepID=A0AA37M3Z3_9HYPH|nr:UDP-N-acetylmuramoyl-L-alanine--D-glutamate ligase [Methylobacterium frigidaeris]PIK70246.1 UDP-N-acetylmuramoyl-L-alanine--D-glutamate ligase [Methylobacterium frigidaeris]GJD61780.1 UDP-N-acetylmuramoylalanine--D-glutamate ligase [Methylobacterium frigidaeris]